MWNDEATKELKRERLMQRIDMATYVVLVTLASMTIDACLVVHINDRAAVLEAELARYKRDCKTCVCQGPE